MLIPFNEHLSSLPMMDYNHMDELQGDLKTLEQSNYERLRNSLRSQGQLAPFFIWQNPETKKYFLVDGHQRKKVLVLEKATPYERPYILIPAATHEEAKKALLAISSQYGTITTDGYEKFTFDFNQDWMNENVFFDNLRAKFSDLETISESEEGDGSGFGGEKPQVYKLIVECQTEESRSELFKTLESKGYTVIEI